MSFEILLEQKILEYHNELSDKYGPVGASFRKLHINNCGPLAMFFGSKNLIEYDAEEVLFFGIRKTVIHEFSHHIQYKIFGYTRHDFLFYLINQLIIILEDKTNLANSRFFVRHYDLHEDNNALKTPLDYLFIYEEINKYSKLSFREAVGKCKLLEVSIFGARDFDDLDYLDDIEKLNLSREQNYGHIQTDF